MPRHIHFVWMGLGLAGILHCHASSEPAPLNSSPVSASTASALPTPPAASSGASPSSSTVSAPQMPRELSPAEQVTRSLDVWKDEKRSLPELRDQLRSLGFRGIHLVGPAPFALDEHDRLPLMAFRVFSASESYGVDFDGGAILVLVRLESNELFAARAFSLREDYVFKPPASKPAEAIVASQFVVNVRERLPGLPWTPGTYISTILLENQSSNRVWTHILPSGAKASPPKPETPGVYATIKMDIPAVITIGQQAPALLKGELRQSSKPAEGGSNTAVSVVIVGQQQQEPLVVRLPLRLSEEKGGTAWVGAFDIDLNQLEAASLLEQDYFVWAFYGEALAGPYRTRVSSAKPTRR